MAIMRPLVNVGAHVRSRPFAAEFEATHTELFEAFERDRKIEAAVAMYIVPAIDELLREGEQ